MAPRSSTLPGQSTRWGTSPPAKSPKKRPGRQTTTKQHVQKSLQCSKEAGDVELELELEIAGPQVFDEDGEAFELEREPETVMQTGEGEGTASQGPDEGQGEGTDRQGQHVGSGESEGSQGQGEGKDRQGQHEGQGQGSDTQGQHEGQGESEDRQGQVRTKTGGQEEVQC